MALCQPILTRLMLLIGLSHDRLFLRPVCRGRAHGLWGVGGREDTMKYDLRYLYLALACFAVAGVILLYGVSR